MFSCEFRGARTLKSTNAVDTGGAIFTRLACGTLIDVLITMFSLKITGATTLISTNGVHTGSPVLTGFDCKAFIHICFAVLSFKAWFADARITILLCDARCTILAGFICSTLVKTSVAAVSKPAYRSPCQFVDIEPVAFLNLNVSVPEATVAAPVKTHFSIDGFTNLCRMRTA